MLAGSFPCPMSSAATSTSASWRRPDTDWAPLPDHQQSDTLDGLEPVCLMDVDPATARHTVEYAGRTVVFCAPACKKQFVADPSAYLSA